MSSTLVWHGPGVSIHAEHTISAATECHVNVSQIITPCEVLGANFSDRKSTID